MDIKKLTLGELAKVEELGGQSISALSDDSKPKMKMLMALAFVVKKRENPELTMKDVEALSMEELENLIGDLTPEVSEGK